MEWNLVLEPAGPAGAFILTDEQLADLGASKRSPVTVTVGGRTARVRLASMGRCNIIGLRRELRTELGVESGERYDVVIELDEAYAQWVGEAKQQATRDRRAEQAVAKLVAKQKL
ncbi:YdeI/OmpD-associated family protein [Aestuariimicrobium ganziense]|uniref:YdeI/OmpD-associated family protein n=1 Tax=Aestuariimicrobium ganziense TaxID=2773677 RepID=UPI0019436A3E|nr:YdeI/OmpD-associated family protein [Aestuariimicrobium ganziense]